MRRYTNTFGDRAFAAASPRLWNSLPSHLRDALIQSRLHYANSVCYGISICNLAKLQRIQNAAAHLVAYQQPKCPPSSLLFNLHWLPIKYRINFKIATLTYKTLVSSQSGYLRNLLSTYQRTRSLHS